MTDAPCANLAEELVKAYPNAKVVLNTRDVDKWLPSMETSYYNILGWKSLQRLAAVETVRILPFHPLLLRYYAGGMAEMFVYKSKHQMSTSWGRLNGWILHFLLLTHIYCQKQLGPHLRLLRLILTDWTSGDWENRTKLREGFVQHYKRVRSIVPKDNLLEHRPQDGWEPLCKFLGKPVPDEPYPCVNQGDNAFQIHVTAFWFILTKLVITYVTPILLAASVVWYLRWKKT